MEYRQRWACGIFLSRAWLTKLGVPMYTLGIKTEMQTLNLYLTVRCDEYHIESKQGVINITSEMLDLR